MQDCSSPPHIIDDSGFAVIENKSNQNFALSLRWIIEQQLPKHPRIEEKDIGTSVENFFIVGMKTEGVEPGFLAVIIDEKFLDRFKTDEVTKEAFGNLSIDDLETLKDLLAKDLYQNEVLKIFAEKLLREGKSIEETHEQKLYLWQIKGEFETISGSDKVSVPQRSLKNSKTVRNLSGFFQGPVTVIYYLGRIIDRKTQNLYYFLECLTADLARAGGTTVHEAYIFFGRHNNNSLQCYIASKWEPRLKTFEGRLAGSQKGTFENYLVKAGGQEKESPTLWADRNGCKFAMHGPEIISHGDEDAINDGPNKGTVDDEFFGFDFGHAHRKRNSFVDTLTPDFFFKELGGKCKNFSLFYDAPLSQMYKGMFLILKTLNSETIEIVFNLDELQRVNQALEAYKKSDEDFKMRWEITQEGALDKIFSAYTMTFRNFSDTAKKNSEETLAEEYCFYMNKITEAYAFARDTRVNMLKVCKEYMLLMPDELDFLDNLRKLTSNTSTRSSNHTVILNHLRVYPEGRILWSLHKNWEEQLIIVTPHLEDKMYTFARTIEILNAYIQQYDLPPDIIKNFEATKQLSFPMEQWDTITQAFCEKNIKSFKYSRQSALHSKQNSERRGSQSVDTDKGKEKENNATTSRAYHEPSTSNTAAKSMLPFFRRSISFSIFDRSHNNDLDVDDFFLISDNNDEDKQHPPPERAHTLGTYLPREKDNDSDVEQEDTNEASDDEESEGNSNDKKKRIGLEKK